MRDVKMLAGKKTKDRIENYHELKDKYGPLRED